MVFPGTDLANLLESCTPSDIIKDIALLSSFRRFLQRGTRLECCELLPEGFRHPSEFTCVQDPLTPRQASVGATPQSHSPRHARLSHEATNSHKVTITNSSDVIKVQRILKSSEQYFEPLNIPEKRKNRLCRVAQRISKTKTHEDYHGIRAFEFALKDSLAIAKEMFQVLVDASQNNVVILHRIYYLYFADAVDRYEISLSDSSIGRSTKSLALDKLAKDLKVKRPNVASMYTLGRKYLTCMEAGGPGSLFSIDGAKSDMEKCNDEDFKLLFEYRKTTHPDLEERSRTLDFGVIHELVCGLRAQGVDDADIAGGHTRLMKMICQYVDTRTFLCQGDIVSNKHLGDGECGNMSDVPSRRSIPSQSPHVQERTGADGQKDISSSPGSRDHRADPHQLPLLVKDSMSVDQSYSNHPRTTNYAKDGQRRLSMPLPFPLAGKSNLDARGIEVRPLCDTIEAERYIKIADNPSKRRRLDDDHSDHRVDRIAITSEAVSLPQEIRDEGTGLDVQDFSTDIDEWLQEFGNVDPSNGMNFVVGLLQTW